MSNLLKNNKELMNEYDFEKNKNIDLNTITCNSNKKIWWKCNNGHEWEAYVNNRYSKHSGCPKCSNLNRKPRGILLFDYSSKLKDEWNYDRNKDIDPYKLGIGSKLKVWWKCDKGHEWESTIQSRTYQKTNCPFCSGRKVLKGFNDLETLNPIVAQEWHPTKNGNLKPSDVTANSGKKVWWLCPNGHEYYKMVKERNQGRECKFCVGQSAIKGVNDLETLNPLLAQEWHPTKNGNLKPSDVMGNTGYKVWWKCKYGHEWEASPNKRFQGRGCPECQKFNRTSLPEFIIYYYLKQYVDDTVNSYKDSILGTMEIDIYSPSKKIGIEYDGVWHKLERDIEKDKICLENKILLIRVRESNVQLYNRKDPTIILKNKSLEELERAIIEIFKIFNINNYSINIKQDYQTILESYRNIKIANNLLEVYPKLAKEWHPTKNGNLSPENIPATTSTTKYWWICPNGHEYEANLANRINRIEKNTCPVCHGKKVVEGINDLASLNPKLASEWNYEKNGDLLPTQVTLHSNKKVWWKCSKGHEWVARINHRSNGTNCPICFGRKK